MGFQKRPSFRYVYFGIYFAWGYPAILAYACKGIIHFILMVLVLSLSCLVIYVKFPYTFTYMSLPLFVSWILLHAQFLSPLDCPIFFFSLCFWWYNILHLVFFFLDWWSCWWTGWQHEASCSWWNWIWLWSVSYVLWQLLIWLTFCWEKLKTLFFFFFFNVNLSIWCCYWRWWAYS